MRTLSQNSLHCCSFPGLIPYAAAQMFLDRQVQARAEERIPDMIYFMEHPSVFTCGRGVCVPQIKSLVGIPVVETNRGGGWTYHGPGQLMIYPVIRLVDRDVHAYLRNLENWVIEALASCGLKARARSGMTGVWIGWQKVASMGIAVRRWVAFHGIALNVVNDLGPFTRIKPCGFEPGVMTRLVDWRSDLDFSSEWRKKLEARLVAVA